MNLIIILFLIGLLLLAAEVLVPGGLLGLIGTASLLVACVLSFIHFGSTGGLITIGAAFFSAILLFYIELKIIPKTRFGKRFFLTHEITATSSSLDDEKRALIGEKCQALTPLSPSGYVSVNGKRYEAVSQSGQISPGTNMKVIDANHLQLTVKTEI